MQRHIQILSLFLLLAGATINLAAGARRPWREREILSGGHHTAIARAAEGVMRHVAPDAALAVVVEESDRADAQGSSIWADQRLKWLLFPRRFDAYLREEDGRVRPLYPAVAGRPVPSVEYLAHEYILFFRAGEPLRLPDAPLAVLEKEPMFVLAQASGR